MVLVQPAVLLADPSWKIYTFSFTMPSNDSNTSLNFEMGNMAGNVWIDNVSVTAGGTASVAQRPLLWEILPISITEIRLRIPISPRSRRTGMK